MTARPLLGAIAVVVHEGHVLLARRVKEPDAGLWGFPGGHVELGETALAAAARELLEETGVTAQPVAYLTNIDVILPGPDGATAVHYLLAAVLCRYEAGVPSPDDDVSDAAWIPVETVLSGDLPMSAQVDDVVTLATDRLGSGPERDRTGTKAPGLA
ncbi:NUDIX hydrolase [Marinibacterium profundimaris]|uniref:NUDIX hydrolase n=1 Tax=Marinibacterium profundimaris TaxID=1679460 RepID=UPI000B523964|nr:NUDIX hydrolase [Marinibacterium profundimaris]